MKYDEMYQIINLSGAMIVGHLSHLKIKAGAHKHKFYKTEPLITCPDIAVRRDDRWASLILN
jgi:hypothetical protein